MEPPLGASKKRNADDYRPDNARQIEFFCGLLKEQLSPPPFLNSLLNAVKRKCYIVFLLKPEQ
jgi:hypothetical protein